MKKYLQLLIPVIGLCILILLFIRGKSPLSLDSKEYIIWVEKNDNVLYSKTELDKFSFRSKFLPSEYVILKDNPNFDFSKKDNESLINGYNQSIYFAFEIKSKTSNDPLHQSSSSMVYNDLLKYFSFDIQNDFKLIHKNDTLDCKLFHFERNYNLTPFLRMNLVFERPKNFEKEDFILTLNEKKLGIGRLKFYYDANDLEEIPNLK